MPITPTQIAGLIAWRLSPLLDVDQYIALLKRVGDPANLLDNPPQEPHFLPLRQKLELRAFRQEIRTLALSWREAGIEVLVLGDARYPAELMAYPDPPFILTYRGTWDERRLRAPRLSIVGSRRADRDGVEIADHFARKIVAAGACVVSGLALGIDGAAHRGAAAAAKNRSDFCPTIAILGNGLMHIYPRSHQSLAVEILERGGVLLSQFDPHEPPYPVNFLNRNRLIAALSLGTLVIQAGDRSGSLVTARHALEFGKELFIVPGSIKDPRYLGSIKLLQHGAHLVTSYEDLQDLVAELRSLPPPPVSAESPARESEHHWLYQLLSEASAIHIDAAQAQSPDPGQFHQQLLMLELDGTITRLPGNMLSLSTESRLSSAK